MPRTLKAFCVVSVTLHTPTIDENGILDTATIDQAFKVPNQSQDITTQLKTAQKTYATNIQETERS